MSIESTDLQPIPWWHEQPEEITELPEAVLEKLSRAGFRTVEEVRAATPAQLLLIPGLGRVTLETIKAWLRKLDGDSD